LQRYENGKGTGFPHLLESPAIIFGKFLGPDKSWKMKEEEECRTVYF